MTSTAARRTPADIAADMATASARRMGTNGIPAAIAHPHAQGALSTLREFDADGNNLGTVAQRRSYVRDALRRHAAADVKLTRDECKRLGYLAMARLDTIDEHTTMRHYDGTPFTVGPYVNHAVDFVLTGAPYGGRNVKPVEHTTTDRDLILQYAMLFNVASRITI